MQGNFARALALTLKFEGGYADQKYDPGGATNFGITLKTLENYRSRPVSKADVKALTQREAADIYEKKYWNALHANDLPGGIDLALFDYAVHSGCPRAVRSLQAVLNITIDGILGSQTLIHVKAIPAEALVSALAQERRRLLQQLPGFAAFGRGWLARVNAIERAALACLRNPVSQTLNSTQGV